MGAITSRVWATGSSDLKLDSVIKLSNGVTMPRLGFGVWQVDPAVCTSVVETALEAGYRHVDSAQAYRNEAEAGAALRSSSVVKRKDVFFTTKIPRDLGSVDKNYTSLVGSVNKINGDGADADAYVDLFLIHTPRMGAEGIKNVWQALEKLLKEGKTRSIGVSNFNGENIQGMKEYATVWPPHVNQIQLNPWVQEKEIVKYCEDNGIVLQAYSPLATGKKLDDPTVGEIAKKYKKSPAQVLIRYALQKGWVPLPKSVHKERIIENTQLYDFDISSEDIATLDGLDGK
ncbi:hypothetical protein INS49_004513 [Diaporthe citri]|uniref:uncharacterized protein n=1 Tax=Diaporthe citri TaxID=83186 RepID=UPI001C7F5B48|nr:uncharacterized protein INS49_004513 [Diaporthe citri]KAG6354496.1 hypothetical protein INS49_004513 [Diaporthe citri]